MQASTTGKEDKHTHQNTHWPAVHLARHVAARVVGGLVVGPKFEFSWLQRAFCRRLAKTPMMMSLGQYDKLQLTDVYRHNLGRTLTLRQW